MSAVSANAQDAGPCGGTFCDQTTGNHAQRLQDAWGSSATTSEQREKMREIIDSNTVGKATNWKAAADGYFEWRAEARAYVYDSNSKPVPAPQPAGPDWGAMRSLAERAVRARLVDPESAKFEWPYGFRQGNWKAILQKRVEGWVTCGTVNARNRMGGFAGSSAFVVVIDNNAVQLVDMDSSNDKFGFVSIACNKSAASFPSPQVGMLDTDSAKPEVAALTSVADELAKLALLRDKGILTQIEFEQQKSLLLSRH